MHLSIQTGTSMQIVLLRTSGTLSSCSLQISIYKCGAIPLQTFVFDKTGKVALVFNSQMDPERHIKEAMAVIKTL